jgi:hypothetical protein
MTLYNPATGTASVSSGTATVTIASADLTAILPGMAIYFGSRDTMISPAYIISTVTPSGTSGGTILLRSNVPSTITTQPFVIDMRSAGNATGFATFVLGRVISALQGLVGAGSSIDGNSRVLELDKTTAGALSWLRFKIAGVNQFEVSQRTVSSVETLALRSTNDGSTFVDAIQVRRTDGQVTLAVRPALPAGIGACGSSALVNTNVGSNTLINNTTGFQNAAFGSDSLRFNTTGNNNAAFGYNALYANTTGNNNTALGRSGLSNNTTGLNNTAVGYAASNASTTGNDNTAVGYAAMLANTTGSGNTALGSSALATNTTGNNNTTVGIVSMNANTTGTSNVALGYAALYSNTTGNSNVALGYASLYYNTTASNAVAIGNGALQTNTTGASNTAVGNAALYSNTTGGSNVAIGLNALYNNTTASNNTALGNACLQNTTTGYSNVGLGVSSLFSNTTGLQNTASGTQALNANTTASNNTANGFQSLVACTTGSGNTALGSTALVALTTATNCTGLGFGAAVTGSNQVQLGDSATTTYVYGTVQNRSDIRDKADIRDTKLGLDFVNSLRPVDYRYDMRDSYKPDRPAQPDADATPEQIEAHKAEMAEWLEAVKLKNLKHDGSKKRSRYHSGIIAQELRDAIDASGFDKKGWGALQDHSIGGGDDVLSVGYDQFVAPLIKAIQELSAKVEKLESAAKKGAK